MNGVEFHCFFCGFPPPDSWLMDVDENGEDYNLLEAYNEKRYAHYLRDFDEGDVEELKRHLENRVRHLLRDDKSKIDIELQTVSPTLDWWRTAKRVRREGIPTMLSPFAERLKAEYSLKKPKEPADPAQEDWEKEKAQN